MSETLFDEVRARRLAPEEAKAILLAVARRHSTNLDLHAAYDRQDRRPGPASGERGDRLVGAAYRLLAERGRAAGLEEDESAFLSACGLDPSAAPDLKRLLSVWREHGLVPPNLAKLRRLLLDQAPGVDPTALVLAEVEPLYYRGMAAACLRTGARWGSTLDADLALVSDAELGPRAPATSAPASSSPPEAPMPVQTLPTASVAAPREQDLSAAGIVTLAEAW